MILKATSHDEISDGIIISFHSRWESSLTNREVHCVFRKRGPRNMKPSWIYVYVGTPTKAIIGRLPVQKMEILPLNECVRHSKKGAITKDELTKYATGYEKLFVFLVGDYQSAEQAVDLENLRNRHGFSPPQSFLVLSIKGKGKMDELCGF